MFRFSKGTRNLLFGEHQIIIHSLFVARAWWRLFGFPKDLRLWACFFLHDIGYWGKDDIDGEDGRTHPRAWGADNPLALRQEGTVGLLVCPPAFMV